MINIFIIFTFLYHFASAKILVLPEEKIEKCSEYAEVDAGYFKVDGVEIVIESDIDVFINGSVKILKPLQSPWKAEYFAEQYYRNKWVRSPVQKKFNDLCLHFHNPTEFWYRITKDLKGCPINAGTEWKYDMKSMTDWPIILPRSFIGKWRMNFIGYFEENGRKLIDCTRGYFEIADV